MLSNHSDTEILLFEPKSPYGNPWDIETYASIAKELGFKYKKVGYHFINREGSLLDPDGNIKFKVLILPGGEGYRWFEKSVGEGLDCAGVYYILKFVRAGGSIIGLCACSSSLFVDAFEWNNPTLDQAQHGVWDATDTFPGWFKYFCGTEPTFKGIVRGPQESNKPYPTTKYLPIKMNLENELVREANLPSVIYQIVVGGGSIIPDEGQPLDVVGWYPNGTVAIGIVPYGDGRIILSNPHPNITGDRAEQYRDQVMTIHARRWGWSDEMIDKRKEIIKTNKDLDGSKPDWELSKAMLSYAYKKASQ